MRRTDHSNHEPQDSLPEILTLPEVARFLRCSKAHISNLVNGRIPKLPRLPMILLGRRKLVRTTSLLGWIRSTEFNSADDN